MTKKIFLLLTILATVILNGGCTERVLDGEQVIPGEKIVLKFSHVVAEDTPKGLAALKLAETVGARSGGRIEIQVYANSSLYSDGEELDALANNNVQIIAPSTSKLGLMYPKWQIFDLPYLFEDSESVHKVMEGPLGSFLFKDIDDTGLMVIAFWDNGFKQMTNNTRPLRLPSDFKDLTFRTMINSRVLEEQFEYLGATPIQMGFNDLYQALAGNAVNGQENTISNIYSQNFFKVQPYITISNHGFMGYAVLVNKEFWSSLDPETRALLGECIKEVTLWERKQALLINERDLEKIKATDDVDIHYQTKEEREAWEKAFEGVYTKGREIVGKDLVDMVTNKK